MLTLLFAILLGMLFAVLATQNPQMVSVQVWDSAFLVPLYIVAGFSFAVGLLLATFFHAIGSLFSWVDGRSQDSRVHQFAKNNQQLLRDIEKLRVTNARLREELEHTRENLRKQTRETTTQSVKNLVGRVRHGLTP